MNEVLTIKEVARVLHTQTAVVMQWYRQGRIKPCNTGAEEQPLFRREDVILSHINNAIRRASRH